MEIISLKSVIALLLLLSVICFGFCTAIDTMTSTRFIEDPETLVSNGSAFKLGFFSLADSTNRYVGIWYSTPSLSTVIWVANRDKPLNDSSGIVTISEDGNLLVMNGQKEIVWSSNVSNAAANSSAQLLDSGNLVLRDNSGSITWESIQHPSDSLLPKMKISTDTNTGEKVVLTSWKSPSDPSIGSLSAGINPLSIPQLFIWNGSHPYWRSGPWDGQIFIGIPDMNSVFHNGFQVVDDKEGTVYATFTVANSSIFLYYVLTPQGTLVETYREYGKEEWEVTWRSNNSECDVYGTCGAFGICNSGNSPICSCLRGYEPKYIEEWSRGNWTSGCVRKTPLQCERTNSSGQQGKLDGFFRLTTVKVPDFADWSLALEDECREQCLKNCSCMAYSYYSGIGCMSWSGNLIDLQKFTQGGADLYIRLANSELDKKKDMKAIISVTIVIGTIAIGICTYFSWRWRRKQTMKDKSKEILLSDRGDAYQIYDMNRLGDNANQVKLEELPLLALEKLATATNNFHEANKLGQGGFGPVYRGKLPGGQEIAVKRLSRASAQGLEEFMNEVMVISKIQHRNLVRLLGCCIEGDEKLLIYEYMPNKSLDAFLFDPLKREFLDWRKRFSIIEGIGRGLLYLHRDSRLRIIHRDLKASNILLDEDLNAKISDFGMARIFGSNQDQANTMRVVGTYGYMSPEYAMEGRFSEKSDVFSFGVLLLEIVSGRRNTSFQYDDQYMSLLGYAWTLWCEHNIKELIDETIAEACFQEEISRCIHVGLLCVQESAKDRPSISTVQPPFLEKQTAIDIESSQLRQNKYSSNQFCVYAIDTFTSTHFIKNSETIVSNGSLFKLGFFSPSNSTKRYVTSVSSVVWVANRDKPLDDTSGIMKISEDGNLQILNGEKEVIWSSNVSNAVSNTTAQLLDSGNLVLKDDSSGRIIWESFQHPSHALLANMKLSTNMYTGERRVLTSWKKASDPSIGSFSVGVDPSNIAQTFIWNGSHPYYRTGPWNGQIFIGVANMNSFVGNGFRMDHDEEGTVSVSFTTSDDFLSLYFTLTPEGTMEEINRQKEDWEVRWESKQTECDVYEEWNRGNWTSGCVRKTPLQCERTNGSIEVGKIDGFLGMVPALKNQCRDMCLKNCSCIAYSNNNGIGCMSWSRDLIDMQKFSSSGADLYIRVADTELASVRREKILEVSLFERGNVHPKFSDANMLGNNVNQVKLEEQLLINFEKLVTATNNFHEANKLGQGGFGKLPEGQEIAVKRLSRASAQGLEEFLNEVMVISNVQHRNLVRLLGCCTEGDENMLVYEYLPNKSLDAFLFDPVKRDSLTWRRRFSIIEGIARGLLYLHRDSRFRIIHRDLKASNILLDEDMNPKISDFGMARIFQAKQDKANTVRIAGTYGYMSPEYAMEGIFQRSPMYSALEYYY
ncbi:hypothetical protein AAG906_028268 [Vitis piasezkii]